MKIVFFGTPEFAVASLDALVKGGHNIAAVVTATDKPAGRGHKLLHSAVKKYALETDIPVLQPEKLRDPSFVEALQEINADLFVVIAFRMLPEIVWSMPRYGTFNLHASLLPRYRGAAPINWAVINGDNVTGVTTFFINRDIDTGDVIAQESIDITDDDNAGTVHDRLMEIGARLTLDTVNSIENGTLSRIPQEQLIAQGEEPTPAPKIFKDTCRIDWEKPASEIHNLVRGLAPYPAAWTELRLTPDCEPVIMKVTLTAITNRTINPGEVKIENGHLYVGTATNALELLQIQPSGRRSMPTADYLRGLR